MYIVELGNSMIEIIAIGTAVRKASGVAVETTDLPVQAIVRDKNTWISGDVGFNLEAS